MLTKKRSKEIAMDVGKIVSEPATQQSYPIPLGQRFAVKFNYSISCKGQSGGSCKSRQINDNSIAPTMIPENENSGFSLKNR